MDKDKLILAGLGVIFVFLLFAFMGVVVVTGYFFMSSSNAGNPAATDGDNTPLIDAVAGDANTGSPAADESSDNAQPPVNNEPAVQEKPVPVCGNNIKEDGEACEVNSHCLADQICSACRCIPKPEEKPTATKLDTIKVEGISFFCAPDFEGKRGLAVKIINFKNTGTTDYSYTKPLTIKSEIGSTTDQVTTKPTFKFSPKAGKNVDLYQKDIARETAPFLFVGTSPGALKLTIQFGETKYVEYSYDVRATDFGKVGCL